MADFCVDCWNEMNETDLPEKKFILSFSDCLCEGCEEYKRVVIDEVGRFGKIGWYFGFVISIIRYPFTQIYLWIINKR